MKELWRPEYLSTCRWILSWLSTIAGQRCAAFLSLSLSDIIILLIFYRHVGDVFMATHHLMAMTAYYFVVVSPCNSHSTLEASRRLNRLQCMLYFLFWSPSWLRAYVVRLVVRLFRVSFFLFVPFFCASKPKLLLPYVIGIGNGISGIEIGKKIQMIFQWSLVATYFATVRQVLLARATTRPSWSQISKGQKTMRIPTLPFVL